MTDLTATRASAAHATIEKLHHVKDCYRVFDTSSKDASLYGVSPDLLNDLTDMGLSAERDGSERLFDSDDLYNISLYLKLPSIHKMAMRSWAKALKTEQPGGTLTVAYSLRGPVPKPVSGKVLTHANGYVPVVLGNAETIHAETVQRSSSSAPVPPELSQIVNLLIDGFEFYMLHDAIRWDVPFMRAHRIGECGGFSKLLVEEASKAGFEARQVFGILASQPFGTGHYWAEVRVNDAWIKLDPLMIQLLTGQKLLDPTEHPVDRAQGGALVMLAPVVGYDEIGAPILAGQDTGVFAKEPIVLNGADGMPVSIAIASADV